MSFGSDELLTNFIFISFLALSLICYLHLKQLIGKNKEMHVVLYSILHYTVNILHIVFSVHFIVQYVQYMVHNNGYLYIHTHYFSLFVRSCRQVAMKTP